MKSNLNEVLELVKKNEYLFNEWSYDKDWGSREDGGFCIWVDDENSVIELERELNKLGWEIGWNECEGCEGEGCIYRS